jgi:hypothetical protein
VITIFGTTYFTIGAGLVVLALAAPFLFWFSRWLWRPNVEGRPRRVRWLAVGGTTLGLLLLVAVGLFWDVYLIGQRAKELCQKTGLVVYRRAGTDGFLGASDLRFWSRHGFRYLEWEYFGNKYRIEMEGDEVKRIPIDAFVSSYELRAPATSARHGDSYIDMHFTKYVDQIIERSSGDILGDRVSYAIRKGWLERALLALSGFTTSPQVCGRNRNGQEVIDGGQSTSTDLVMNVLTPK